MGAPLIIIRPFRDVSYKTFLPCKGFMIPFFRVKVLWFTASSGYSRKPCRKGFEYRYLFENPFQNLFTVYYKPHIYSTDFSQLSVTSPCNKISAVRETWQYHITIKNYNIVLKTALSWYLALQSRIYSVNSFLIRRVLYPSEEIRSCTTITAIGLCYYNSTRSQINTPTTFV